MGKRHPNLATWQWRTSLDNHRQPTHQVLQLMAIPLFIVAFLLIVTGMFSQDLADVAIGIIGMFASLALQRHRQ